MADKRRAKKGGKGAAAARPLRRASFGPTIAPVPTRGSVTARPSSLPGHQSPGTTGGPSPTARRVGAGGLVLFPVVRIPSDPSTSVDAVVGATATRRRRHPQRGLRRASVIVALVAVSAIAATVTVGILTAASPTQSSSFAAGAVAYGSTASSVCRVGAGSGASAPALLPGDASSGWTPSPGVDAPCDLSVTYHGTTPAYLGVDVLIASRAGTPPASAPAGTVPATLFDGSSTGLQLRVTDTVNGTAPYVDGVTYRAQGASGPATPLAPVACPAGYSGTVDTCYLVTDLLVRATPFTDGQSDTVVVNYQLPATSTSGYQNSSASVVITVHAVQAGGNPLPASPSSTACVATAQCVIGFLWR